MKNMNKTVWVRVRDQLKRIFPKSKYEERDDDIYFYPSEEQGPYRLEARDASKNSVNASSFQHSVIAMRHGQSPGVLEGKTHLETPILLVLPYVNRSFHEWLREHGHQFIDSSGNAYLEGHGYKIWIEGRKKSDSLNQSPSKGTSRAFTVTGLRVVFVLLVLPDLLSKPVRTIADAAGVSLGAAAYALQDLERDKHILVNGRKRRWVNESRTAQLWMALYATVLKPKLKSRRCAGPTPHEIVDKLTDAWKGEAQLGGEAAMLAKGYGIRPIETRFYGDFPWGSLTHRLRLVPSEAGNVILMERFWNPSYFPDTDYVPTLLIFSDESLGGDERQSFIAQEMWRADEDLQRFRD